MEKIEVTKGTNMIPLVFNITDFQIPKTASATAYITGASGKTKKKLCDVAGNKITLEPTSDLFSVGNNDIQIRIVDDTKTLVTFNTNCCCENSVEFGDAAEEKEQTLIEQLLASQGKIQTGLNNEVEERKKQAKNLEDNKLDKTGDASDTTIDFTENLNRENIVTGENARTMFGKIAKWFSDIKEAAFAKVANNLDTTEEGYVLDARQGKKIKEDIADLNSNFVESKIWKLHTSKTGSDVIILPETYGELLVYVKTESSHIWTSNIPFGATKGYIRTGCDGEKIVWNYGTTKINLATCNVDGASLINKATTYVYYR